MAGSRQRKPRKPIVLTAPVRIAVESIIPSAAQRELDASIVELLARSIEVDGLLHPIIVQKQRYPEYRDRPYVLVAGGHRLEAHKLLGRQLIDAYVMPANAQDEAFRMTLAENFARSELSPLERADAIWIWIYSKGAPRAHPLRNRQPHDAGVSLAAKELGISRRSVQRALKIAGLSRDAKRVARELSLDKNERLLLEVAGLPADDQPTALREYMNNLEADSKDAKAAKQLWGRRLLEIWNQGRPAWRLEAVKRLAEREAKKT